MADACTLWPEGWWSHCCQAHDAAYLAQSGKLAADWSLLQCVADAAPLAWLEPVSAAVGAIMFVGVSLGGAYFYRRAN